MLQGCVGKTSDGRPQSSEIRLASCNIIARGHDGSCSVLFTGHQQGISVQKAETNEGGTKVLQSEQPLEILLFQIRQIKSGLL